VQVLRFSSIRVRLGLVLSSGAASQQLGRAQKGMLARVPAVLVSNRPASRSAVGAGAVAGALSPGEPPMVSSKRVPKAGLSL